MTAFSIKEDIPKAHNALLKNER